MFTGLKSQVGTKWKAQTIANTSEQQFKVEFECEFLGSVDTLISAPKLRSMTYDDPIKRNAGLDVYKEPIKDLTTSWLLTLVLV